MRFYNTVAALSLSAHDHIQRLQAIDAQPILSSYEDLMQFILSNGTAIIEMRHAYEKAKTSKLGGPQGWEELRQGWEGSGCAALFRHDRRTWSGFANVERRRHWRKIVTAQTH